MILRPNYLLIFLFLPCGLFAQFDWSNYRYVHLQQVSNLTIKTSGKDDVSLSLIGVLPVVSEGFEKFDPERSYRKTPACLLLEEDEFKYMNRFEVAVLFGKLSFNEFGTLNVDFFDATSGWDTPVLSLNQSAVSQGGFIHQLESSARYLKGTLATKIKTFDEAGSNAYFNQVQITAVDFLASDPLRQGLVQKERVEYRNVLFQSNESHQQISSIFVVSKESNPCNQIESNSDGLAQIVSLKLMRHYKVLDRSNLDTMLAEQKLSMTGLTDESTLLSIGQIQGSEGIVFCQETCVSGQQMQTVKLLDCSTGEQQWIATGFGGNPLELMDAIIQEITH